MKREKRIEKLLRQSVSEDNCRRDSIGAISKEISWELNLIDRLGDGDYRDRKIRDAAVNLGMVDVGRRDSLRFIVKETGIKGKEGRGVIDRAMARFNRTAADFATGEPS